MPYTAITRTFRGALTSVEVNGLHLYFSYDTCVAFSRFGVITVQKNTWGAATGRHLNEIDGGTPAARDARVDSRTFKLALEVALTGL